MIALLDAESLDQGHYVLVIRADSDGVSLIDGTTGDRYWCAAADFVRSWRGYVIVAARTQPHWLLAVVISAAGWVLIGSVVLRSKECVVGVSSASDLETQNGPR